MKANEKELKAKMLVALGKDLGKTIEAVMDDVGVTMEMWGRWVQKAGFLRRVRRIGDGVRVAREIGVQRAAADGVALMTKVVSGVVKEGVSPMRMRGCMVLVKMARMQDGGAKEGEVVKAQELLPASIMRRSRALARVMHAARVRDRARAEEGRRSMHPGAGEASRKQAVHYECGMMGGEGNAE